MPYLWAPVVAASFLFSMYWLAKALLLFHPQLRRQLRRCLTCGSGGKPTKDRKKPEPAEPLTAAEEDVEQQFACVETRESDGSAFEAIVEPPQAAAPRKTSLKIASNFPSGGYAAEPRQSAAMAPAGAAPEAAASSSSPKLVPRETTTALRFQEEISKVELSAAASAPPAGGFGKFSAFLGSDDEDTERKVPRRKSSMVPPLPPTIIEWTDINYRCDAL